MRVIFVIGELALGGAERHLTQVLPALRDRGIEPVVYGLTGKGELACLLENQGIAVHTVFAVDYIRRLPNFLRRAVWLVLTFATLVRTIRRVRPNAIHMFLPEAYLIGSLAAMVAACPTRIMSRRSRNFYQLRRPLLARIERWLHKRTDLVLGNSLSVCADLSDEGVRSESLGLIYNGVEIPDVDRERMRVLVREKLNLRTDSMVLTMIANLIPYKGHADLLSALAEVDRRLNISWTMILIGEDRGIGKHLIRLSDELGILGKIQWLGKRMDVMDIYSASDIGVLSSHEEGFSNAVLEGMAVGTPMVVTDVGGNAEAVIDGECGIVVPPGDPLILADALEKLMLDQKLRLRLGANARLRALSEFSNSNCAERYMMYYEKFQSGNGNSFAPATGRGVKS